MVVRDEPVWTAVHDIAGRPLSVAQAPLGSLGSVPYPRLTFTPSELLSNWRPSPCKTVLSSPRRGVTPATTTAPLSRSIPITRSEVCRHYCGVAEINRFPRSRSEPLADGVRLLSSPFDAAASSGPGVVPSAVGIEPSRYPAFPERLTSSTRPWWRVSRFRHLRGIEAIASPCLANPARPQSRALSGVCGYPGRARCLPRRALACGLLDPQVRGIDLPSYDRRQALMHRAQIAPRGAQYHRRTGDN